MLLNLRGAGRSQVIHDSEIEMSDFTAGEWAVGRANSPIEFSLAIAERESLQPSPDRADAPSTSGVAHEQFGYDSIVP